MLSSYGGAVMDIPDNRLYLKLCRLRSIISNRNTVKSNNITSNQFPEGKEDGNTYLGIRDHDLVTLETEAVAEVERILEQRDDVLVFEKIIFNIPSMDAIADEINSRKQLDQIEFIDCQFANDILESWLNFHWDNIKIAKLKLRRSIIHGDVNAKAILHAVKEWKVEELDLSNMKLESVNPSVLEGALWDSFVVKLMYNYASNSTTDEIKNILLLLHGKKKLEVLELIECDLTKEHLNILLEQLERIEVEECEFSYNEQIDFTSESLQRLVKQSNIRRLSLRGCNVTDEALKGIAGVQIEMLNLSENNELVAGKMENLGLAIGSMNVKELSLEYCELDDDKVKQLHEALQKCKFEKLDIHENSGMDDIAYENLGRIVHSCSLQTLNISECQPTESNLEALTKSFEENNVQIPKLYMDQRSFTLTRKFTRKVVKLLSFITEELHLCYRKIGIKNRKTLRDELKNKNLKIILDFKEDILRASNQN